jgi:hypothetical protein
MKPKLPATNKIRKPLPLYGNGELPVGTEIIITEEWDVLPSGARAKVILDPAGDRRLVQSEDLDYALGAH